MVLVGPAPCPSRRAQPPATQLAPRVRLVVFSRPRARSQLAARASLEPQRVWLGTSEPAPPRLGHCLPALTSRRVGGAILTNPSTATERLLQCYGVKLVGGKE